jgi:hypothetical protein
MYNAENPEGEIKMHNYYPDLPVQQSSNNSQDTTFGYRFLTRIFCACRIFGFSRCDG